MADTTVKRASSSLSLRDLPNTPGLDRDNYPTALFFRYGDAVELHDIKPTVTPYHHAAAPTATSSGAPPAESAWDSKGASNTTKPTSHGTNQSTGSYNGKRKGVIMNTASSLSATHGSGSDTDREAHRYEDTFGIGDWAAEPSTLPRPPTQKSKKRSKKSKKPEVVIEQHGRAAGAPLREEEVMEEPGSSQAKGSKVKYLRRRKTKFEDDVDDLDLAEEGGLRSKPHLASQQPLSRLRFVLIVASFLAIALTLILGGWGISRTRHQMYCVKPILFGSVTLIYVFTAIIMVAWRRVLTEILLMALVEFLIGSMLLFEIGEFMERR